MKIKEPTATGEVFDMLVACDDFMTNDMLAKATRQSKDRVNSALWMLQQYHAVECVRQQDKLWWFATPDRDGRTKTVKERAPETRPRRSKKRA